MSKRYDIVIIGSGVIGSSIAYHLSESQQEEVLVIDKGFPLSGTSGSTQAWVWVHSKAPASYGELSMFSAELYPILEKKIGDVEYKRTGGISPFFSESEREKALMLAEKQATVGIPIEVLSQEEVLSREPALSPNIVGATYSPIDGNVNPFRLVELFIRAAKKNNVEFSFYTSVTSILKKNGLFEIETEKGGKYTAKKIIFAGGPWMKELASLIDIKVPVKQVRGQILITEPLTNLIKHTIAGMRQADNGEVLIGYSLEEVGYDRRTTLDIIQNTAQMAIDYIPSLANANIVRAFSGIRVIPEDELPIIGEIPNVENAYISVMHSGITLSPIIGTLMAELLLHGDTSIDLQQYSLSRFDK
ncbi:FAD-binding oxidoreductase [Sporosarcina sp. ACRSM]|uniref:NAD(P)/FAD-dependent oxidoreductase n=1 Tax=Sporosarcina sp. ACRSM TaxID=2918216 RepID=UPI001EF447EF|nr:FAD-binding oxidoreductase [Sporosarcina sp. ACRSM]